MYSIKDNRKKRLLHVVETASWSLPLAQWKTACGWPFASEKADVAFETEPAFSRTKCRKCSESRTKRDGVREDAVWRLQTKTFLESKLPQDQKNERQTAPSKKRRARASSFEKVEGGICNES